MKSRLVVLDASVAIKWFVQEEEKAKEAAAVLKEVETTPASFAVPELFFNEMLAVFCRLGLPKGQIAKNLDNLAQLGLHRIGNGSELLTKGAHLAVDYRLTGYDAVYAASAALLSGTWLTADERAHKRIEPLRISRLL